MKKNKRNIFEMMEILNPDYKSPKKNINENFEEKIVSSEEETLKKKIDKIKSNIDDLMSSGDFESIDTLYQLIVDKSHRMGKKITEDHSIEHAEKIENIKNKLDKLFMNDKYDVIDKLDVIVDRITGPRMGLNEDIEIYYNTLGEAIDAARKLAEERGFDVDEDTLFNQLGTGGIGYEETKSAIVPLYKNGVEQKKALSISIYRMPSGKYELTTYIN